MSFGKNIKQSNIVSKIITNVLNAREAKLLIFIQKMSY